MTTKKQNEEALREAFYEREKVQMALFKEEVFSSMSTLFKIIEEKIDTKGMMENINLRIESSNDYRGNLYFSLTSDNLAKHIGIMSFAIKEMKICGGLSFSFGRSYYEEIDYTKDYTPQCCISIGYAYTHHNFGSNGHDIGLAIYKEGKWEVRWDCEKEN